MSLYSDLQGKTIARGAHTIWPLLFVELFYFNVQIQIKRCSSQYLFQLICIRYLLKEDSMSDEMKSCPTCECPYGYELRENLYSCPECSHEWDAKKAEEETGLVVKDMNGKILQNGDSVVVMKDLPVKGAPKPVKAGTKVKNIRLRDAEHDIDCKIKGFGQMGLKSEFVKKA